MNSLKRTLLFLLLLPLFLSAEQVLANATIPTADLEGTQDSPLIGRFAGSYIVSTLQRNFDEMVLPLSQLIKEQDKRDNHNNIWFGPEQKKTVEGKRTRLVYVTPEGTTPLEVTRNYEQEFDGELLYACKENECGGDISRSSGGGGGHMSLAMFLLPADDIKDTYGSNGHCAQTGRIHGQRYLLMKAKDEEIYISLLAYQLKESGSCKTLNERTIAVLDILESAAMENKMVTISAEEMAREISTTGSVALYGIYFDSDKAVVKPESTETLEQISRYMTDHPEAKLLVVGHTDNTGAFDYNMTLSRQRAAAVVDTLTSNFGINSTRLKPVGVSYACPVSTNTTAKGKALNRRVELVDDTGK